MVTRVTSSSLLTFLICFSALSAAVPHPIMRCFLQIRSPYRLLKKNLIAV